MEIIAQHGQTLIILAVMFGLFNCVATPVVAYTLYRLFKVRPEVVSPRA